MNNENQCDKYEAYFVFQNEEAFNEHLKNCPDCQKEHEKYMKVSQLVKQAAPEYLKQQERKKVSGLKKLACCFVLFVGLSAFTGYQFYDNYSYQYDYDDNSYVSALGLPIDDYGFLDL